MHRPGGEARSAEFRRPLSVVDIATRDLIQLGRVAVGLFFTAHAGSLLKCDRGSDSQFVPALACWTS